MSRVLRQKVIGPVPALWSYVRVRELRTNYEEVRHVPGTNRAYGAHDCMQRWLR